MILTHLQCQVILIHTASSDSNASYRVMSFLLPSFRMLVLNLGPVTVAPVLCLFTNILYHLFCFSYVVENEEEAEKENIFTKKQKTRIKNLHE